MGLDMYLNGKKYLFTDWKDQSKNQTEDGFRVCEKTLELGYWRKHPNLHGYIVKTFADGVDECQEIGLSSENLKQIMQAIKDRDLPETSGFFFGRSYGTDEEANEDLAILEKALAWLDAKVDRESRSVVYRASW